MVGLLLKAILPYATALRTAEAGGEVSLRCCKGLRAKTLSQRLTCWQPFRRWLLTTGHLPFPDTPQLFLE